MSLNIASPAQDTWYKRVLTNVPKASYLQETQTLPVITTICLEGARLCRSFKGDASQLFQHDKDRGGLGLGMAGVAMIASYLKEKHHLAHLYVCSSLEAFQTKLEEINHSTDDIRAALVIPWRFVYRTDASANYTGDAGHKLTVCIEKKAGLMKVAIMDSLGKDLELIDAYTVRKKQAEDLNIKEPTLDIILWYIQHSNVDLSRIKIYYCRPTIQWNDFGCETFSLRMAVSFLRYPQFFDRILTNESKLCFQVMIGHSASKLFLQEITHLPFIFLKGVQSRKVLLSLMEEYLEKITPRPSVQELSDLWSRLKKHTVRVYGTSQNHYIDRRSHKYHQMALAACKILSEVEVAQILKTTLLTDVRPLVSNKPMTPSDNILSAQSKRKCLTLDLRGISRL